MKFVFATIGLSVGIYISPQLVTVIESLIDSLLYGLSTIAIIKPVIAISAITLFALISAVIFIVIGTGFLRRSSKPKSIILAVGIAISVIIADIFVLGSPDNKVLILESPAIPKNIARNVSGATVFTKHDFLYRFNFKTDHIPSFQIIKYVPQTYIWSDRRYLNHQNHSAFQDLHLVRIPKHIQEDIHLESTNQITVLRILCDKNDNNTYKEWVNTGIEVMIVSESCMHSRVVTKDFAPGNIKVSAGGPISADPIFIQVSNS